MNRTEMLVGWYERQAGAVKRVVEFLLGLLVLAVGVALLFATIAVLAKFMEVILVVFAGSILALFVWAIGVNLMEALKEVDP